MTVASLQMQPVWINGKLVTPKGYVSPEERERQDRIYAECEAAQKAIKEAAARLAPPQPDNTAQRPVATPQWPEDMR